MKKRAISLLLAMVMILSTIASPIYAVGQNLPKDKVEAGNEVPYTNEGNKKIFKIDKRAIKEVKEPALRSALQSNRLRRAPINATRKETMTVKLTTKGLGNGAQNFDWSLFNNSKFTGELLIYDVDDNEYYPEKDGKRVTIDFTQDGEQTIEFEVPVGLNVDSYNIVVKTIDNFEVRATYTNASTSPSGAELKLEFTVIELASPFVEVIYQDSQGQELAADKLPTTTGVNITAEGVKLAGQALSIPLPTDQYTKYNIAQGIAGKGRATTQELNNLTDAIKYKVDGKDSGLITLDDKEFKLSITNSLKDGSQIVLTLSKADQLRELGGLNPKTIKVWKDDDIDWKSGVEPADKNSDAAWKLIEEAIVTDITVPARGSSKAGKFEGKLKLTFDDGSSLEVDKQMLIVSEHVVVIDPNNTDPDAPQKEDLPRDKITVIFKAGEGIDNINTNGKTTYAKPNATLADTDFPTNITYKDGYKNEVTWEPTDHKVDTNNRKYYNGKRNTFTFKASADKTVIPTNPDDPQTPQGYVLVTFEKGDHGTLKGIGADGQQTEKAAKLAYNVKDTATYKDLKAYEPTIVADKEWKVADAKWAPALGADDAKVTANKHVAQYAEDKTVIPTNPDDPQTPQGYVLVTFEKGDHGTLKGIGADGQQTEKAAKLAYNVKDTATYKDLKAYEPTIVADKEWKVADAKWAPALGADDAKVTANKHVAQYAEDKTVIPTNPDDPQTPQGYVLVTFEKGDHGTLKGIGADGQQTEKAAKLAYNVKDTATYKDLKAYEPTIVADKEWKVADAKWAPALGADDAKVTANKHVAQYAEDKTVIPTNPDDPQTPQGYVLVTFEKGDHGTLKGIGADGQQTEKAAKLAYNVKDTATYKDLKAYEPTIVADKEWKVADAKWAPALGADDAKVTANKHVAQYAEDKTVIPTNPDDPQTPQGYVLVTFEKGDHGTLKGIGADGQQTEKAAKLAYNVKDTATYKDLKAYEPTIVADKEWKVADAKWAPALGADDAKVTANKHVAQYAEDKTVIPTNPDDPQTPQGYVLVTFEKGDHGTLKGIGADGQQTEKAAKLAYNVKDTATYKDLKAYEPTIVADKEWKVADAKWAPALGADDAKVTANKHVAQYAEDKTVIPTNPDDPQTPQGYVLVTFEKGDHGTLKGIGADGQQTEKAAKLAYNVKDTATYKDLKAYEPTIVADKEWKVADAKWAPALGADDAKVTANKHVAQYAEDKTVIPTNPDDPQTPQGYVLVTFEKGDHGTLKGIGADGQQTEKAAKLAYNVKDTATYKDLKAYEPTIVADKEWKVADAKWAPALGADDAKVTANKHVAQYAEDKTVIPTNPDDPQTPQGYVLVTFEKGDHGTLKGIGADGQQTEKAAKLAYNVKDTATYKDLKAYEPTIVADKEWKVADAKWAPALGADDAKVTANKHVAQYAEDKTVIPTNPDDPQTPQGYVLVTFEKGDHGTLKGIGADGQQTEKAAKLAYNVKDTATYKDLKAYEPTIVADKEWKVADAKWAPALGADDAKVTANKHVAQYAEDKTVIPTNPDDPQTPQGYVLVTFEKGDHGTLKGIGADGQQTEKAAKLAYNVKDTATYKDLKAYEPTIVADKEWKVADAKWAPALGADDAKVTANKHVAQYAEDKTVIPTNPDDPQTPQGYVLVTFEKGDHGTLKGIGADGQQTEKAAKLAYNVKDTATYKDLKAYEPTIVADKEWKVADAKWAPALGADDAKVTANKHVAQYAEDKTVIPTNPDDPQTPQGYVLVTFEKGDHGTLKGIGADGQQTEKAAKLAYNVKDTATYKDLKAYEPTIVADKEWKVADAKWAPALGADDAKVTANKHVAQYAEDKTVIPTNPDDPQTPQGYVLVTFEKGDHGTLKGIGADGQQTEKAAKLAYNVKDTATYKDLKAYEPTIVADKEWKVADAKWAPALGADDAKVTANKHVAQYAEDKTVIPTNPDDPQTPQGYVLVTFEKGDHGTLKGIGADGQQTEKAAKLAYNVKDTATYKDLKAYEPTIVADKEWKVADAKWAPALGADDAKVTANKHVAQYAEDKTVIPTNPDDPQTPQGYVLVTFEKGDHGTLKGIGADGQQTEKAAKLAYNVKDTATYKDLKAYEPTIVADKEWKVADAKWAPALGADDAKVTANKHVAQYAEDKTVIPTNPDDPQTPQGYVLVTFEKGDHGTLKGIGADGQQTEKAAKLAYNVKDTATYKDLKAYEPTIVADKEWKVADAKWAPALGADDAKVTANKHVAQYAEDKTVIPTNPDDPQTPQGYVLVTFEKGDHGTLKGIGADGQQTEKAAKLAYNVKDTATYKDLKAYEPTIVADKEWKVADAKWAPALGADDAKVTANKHVAQYAEDKTVIPTNPDDPQTPQGYVLVTFEKGDHGTLKGIGADGQQTEKAAKLAYNVKDTATYKDLKAYEPTIVADKEWKVADAKWAPALGADDAKVTANKHVAQYAEDNTPTKNSEDYDPHYTDKSGKPGETVQIDAPTFTKKGVTGNVPAPNGTTFTNNNPGQSGVTVDPNTGAITVVIPQDAPVGSTITIEVDVTYPDRSNETVEVKVTVSDNTQPKPEEDKSKTPIVDPVDDGDTSISGKGEPGSDIIINIPGKDPIKTTVDDGGKWIAPIDPAHEGDVIKVVQIEVGKKPSVPAYVTVGGRSIIVPSHDDGGHWWFGGGSFKPVETEEQVIDKTEHGIHIAYIFGYKDHTFRCEGKITRAEAASMIAHIAKLDLSDNSKPDFKDTPSSWYNAAINAMVKKNLMFADKNGNFRPNEPITRGEFARAIQFIDKENKKEAPFMDIKGHEFEEAINQAYANGRIAGYPDGTFKPDESITRAEAVTILNNFDGRMVRERGIEDVKKDLIKFTDLKPSHWAYYEIIEASNSHAYSRISNDSKEEKWSNLIK